MPHNIKQFNTYRGFTLMELIVTVAIVGIMAGVALPSFSTVFDKNKLTGTLEISQQTLNYVRSEAVRLNKPVTISFGNTTGVDKKWCVGFSDAGICDCFTTNSCKVDSTERVINPSKNINITLKVSKSIEDSHFSPERGFLEKSGVPVSGNLEYSVDKTGATISINQLGRSSICSNSMSQYSKC